MRTWGRVKPKKKGKHSWLFPHVNHEWTLDYKKRGTFGVGKAAISRMEEKFGFPKSAQLHSARNFFATCAGQLLYGREFREKLGRRTAGILMPDRYDRAECATELRLRSEIIEKLNSGRRPTKAYEVPPTILADEQLCKKENKLSESESDTEETSETSLPEDIANLEGYV